MILGYLSGRAVLIVFSKFYIHLSIFTMTFKIWRSKPNAKILVHQSLLLKFYHSRFAAQFCHSSLTTLSNVYTRTVLVKQIDALLTCSLNSGDSDSKQYELDRWYLFNSISKIKIGFWLKDDVKIWLNSTKLMRFNRIKSTDRL